MKPRTAIFWLFMSWALFLIVVILLGTLYNNAVHEIRRVELKVDKHIREQRAALSSDLLDGYHVWKIDFPDGGKLLVVYSEAEIHLYPFGGYR